MASGETRESTVGASQTRFDAEVDHDIQRLGKFLRYNAPANNVGLVIIVVGLYITHSPAVLVLLAAVIVNTFVMRRARQALEEGRVDAAVVQLSAALWMVCLALWTTLPELYGVAVLIAVLPILLAAAYVRRSAARPLMVAGVAVSVVGAGLYPFRPILGEVGLPDLMVEVLVVVFVPVLVAFCAVAVWHSVVRLLELLEETRESNKALAVSERELESKVELRTADLQRSERDLARARDDALAANRAKSTFLANMSHELRTPLNAIIGYSEMLQEDARDAGQDDFVPDLDKIVTAGRHLLGLINDVLDLSKIEAGKVELLSEQFDVAKLLEDAASTVEPLIAKQHNVLELASHEDLGSMCTDLTRLRQILFNLLSNAAKFTENGSIVLRGSRIPVEGDDWLEFRVSDTGIGMTPDQLARIFEAFSQAEASTTRDYGGTGLGLAITRRFCEMLGGRVEVTSEPGRGTEFVVSIPADLSSAAAAAPEELERDSSVAARSRAGGGLGTILVIDDEPGARELLRRTLERAGYRVECATSGERGLSLAREIRPDLITLDILMPQIDGWSVLTTLKADDSLQDIPVIVVTMTDDQELGYALGAADYMSKPIDRARLTRVVERLVVGRDAPILVVEDEGDTRELLKRTLEKAGFEVRAAENGRLALEQIRQRVPSLILLDLVMPEMNGFELLAALREEPEWRDIPIVVVTAKELTFEEREELNGATLKVLEKGAYSRDALLAEVRFHLDQRGDNDPA